MQKKAMLGQALTCNTLFWGLSQHYIEKILQRFDMIHSPESSEWTLRIHKVAQCLDQKLIFAENLLKKKEAKVIFSY